LASNPFRPIDVLRSVLFYPAFYLGSVVCVVVALAMLPLSQPAFLAAVRGWAGYHRACARALLGIRVRIEGSRPSAGPVLFALRHESFFEAIDLPWLFDQPVVFAKAQLLRIPGWGFAGRRFGLVPVEREAGAKALRAMIAAARAYSGSGRPLAIFPEGTRVPAGTTPPLQAGFAGLYKLLALPVVPVAVDSGRLYHGRWKRPGTITYRFADPIPPGLPREEVERRVGDAIHALIR
jgi:1-acyl-sn-glycerol-3-phosphate acyltransferase